MARCEECVHFGICKKGFPFADGKGGGWCEDFLTADVAPKSAWISVDERLPDPGLPILIFTRKNRYYVGYYYKAVVDTTYTGFYADSVKRDVTHWMPMPEPPITDKPTQEQ